MFAAFLFVVWFLFVLVPVLEKKAKGQPGGVSILPGFPIFPVIAWGLAALLDFIHDRLGYYIIGGLHIILLAVALGFSAKYLYAVKRKT